MWPNPQETAGLVTFTEKILNGKLHFLCSTTNFWHNKWSFPLWISVKETADLVAFTEEMRNGNFIFCAVRVQSFQPQNFLTQMSYHI